MAVNGSFIRRFNDSQTTHNSPAVFGAHFAQVAIDFAVGSARGLDATVARLRRSGLGARLAGGAVVQRYGDHVLAACPPLHFACRPVTNICSSNGSFNLNLIQLS